MRLPNSRASVDALVDRGVAERHERDHVHGADARVLALVDVHVDACDCLSDGRFHGVGDVVGGTGEGQHAPIVVAIGRPIEQMHACHGTHLRCDGIDDVKSPPFAEVWNALDELGHGWASV